MNGPIAQFWLERTPDKREVTGSSPVRPTRPKHSAEYRVLSTELVLLSTQHFALSTHKWGV